MTTLTLSISGMTCGHCLRTVDAALRAVPGVTVDHLKVGSARLTIDETTTSTEHVIRAVEEAGYRAAPVATVGAA